MIIKIARKSCKFAASWLTSFYRIHIIRAKILKAGGCISKSSIYIAKGAKIEVGNRVILQHCIVRVLDGSLVLRDNVIVGHEDPGCATEISINSGRLEIQNNSRIRSNIKIRFGGQIRIGSYTAINEGSELRCDESITIGSYCMISYGCKIYDTNTHCILPYSERRALTMRDYPFIGIEYSKPRTAKVIIGDDVWMGVDSMVLKGVSVGSRCIIGAKALVSKPGEYRNGSLIVSPAASIVKDVNCVSPNDPQGIADASK